MNFSRTVLVKRYDRHDSVSGTASPMSHICFLYGFCSIHIYAFFWKLHLHVLDKSIWQVRLLALGFSVQIHRETYVECLSVIVNTFLHCLGVIKYKVSPFTFLRADLCESCETYVNLVRIMWIQWNPGLCVHCIYIIETCWIQLGDLRRCLKSVHQSVQRFISVSIIEKKRVLLFQVDTW